MWRQANLSGQTTKRASLGAEGWAWQGSQSDEHELSSSSAIIHGVCGRCTAELSEKK